MDSRCPRKLKNMPTAPCAEGRKAVDAARAGCEGGCPWFIADREANYCFFKYMADQGQRPVDPARIAQKLLIDDNEVKRTVQMFKKKAQEILGTPPDSSEK